MAGLNVRCRIGNDKPTRIASSRVSTSYYRAHRENKHHTAAKPHGARRCNNGQRGSPAGGAHIFKRQAAKRTAVARLSSARATSSRNGMALLRKQAINA